MMDPAYPQGLSKSEVQKQLQKFGTNELPASRKIGPVRRAAQIFAEPMILLMVSCVAVYLAMGQVPEGLFLLASLAMVLGISAVQQERSETALEKLRELSSPRAIVIRDGHEFRIPAREVVPEDIIVVQEGDRVPADATLVSVSHLFVDESLVTGESASVRKSVGASPLGSVLSGTMVVKGRGLARVERTGGSSTIGRIGGSIGESTEPRTKLQTEISGLVRVFGAMGFVVCILIAVVYAVTRHDWPNALLAGLSAAMALLPEEFPVVLTIFTAMGAWRLSRMNVLTRKVSAIEGLGTVTALCVDKTGTLTENKMSVRRLRTKQGSFDLTPGSPPLPEEFHPLLEFGALASTVNPFDPTEKAIFKALTQQLAGTEHVHSDWQFVEEYPLTDELLAMSCVWRRSSGEYVIAAKGASEAIVDLCRSSAETSKEIQRATESMAAEGLRVLGVARAHLESSALPARQRDFEFEYVGLIGLEDPLRPGVRDSIRRSDAAGVRVYMMTGDYPVTAARIAREAGIGVDGAVLTGLEIERLSEPALRERLTTTRVFARTTPSQKLRIVNALKENGDVVAMTGDGVNDAPSLKWADIGIAMGRHGTDVAREASDLVLLDDRFESIVNGIEQGRLVAANLRRAMRFICAAHVPIAGLSVAAVVLDWPLLLLPAHIAFLELVIDPSCTLLFENAPIRSDLMKLPPRPAGKKLFSWLDVLSSSGAGGIVMLVILVSSFGLRRGGFSFDEVRAVAFFSLVIANFGFIAIFSESWRPLFVRRRFAAMLAAVTVASVCVATFPWSRRLFAFPSFSGDLLFAIGGVAATAVGLSLIWDYFFSVARSRKPKQTTRYSFGPGGRA